MILVDYLATHSSTASFDHPISSTDATFFLFVANGGTARTATLNGVNLTRVASLASGVNTDGCDVFISTTPPAGQINVTLSATVTCTVLTLLGVDKSSINLPSSLSATGSGTTITHTIDTKAGGLLLSYLQGIAGATVSSNLGILLGGTPTNQFLAYQTTDGQPTSATWTYTSAAISAVTISMAAKQPTSIAFPKIAPRETGDIAQSGVGADNTVYGYYPTTFYQNSFLHTIGRILPQAPPPVITFTPSMSTLQDAFHATTLEPNRWSLFTAGGATFTTSPSGAGTVYPASTTSSTDGDISSVNVYDLTGSYAFVHVISTASLVSSSSDNTFAVRINGSNSLQFQMEAGTLFAQQIVAGSQTNLHSQAFSGVYNAWWRIRESSGIIYWEVAQDSPSGPVGWSTFWQTPNPIAVTGLRALLAGTSFGVDTNPGTFLFDNFNTLPVGLFDVYEFQPNPYTFYSSEFWYTVGRILPPSSSLPPTLVAETELETSQIVIDKITQQASASGTGLTSDHLVSSQDAVMLIFASQMGVSQGLNSVNLNGVALNALGNPSVSTLTAGAYFIVNPPVGINTVSSSVTLPTALELIVMTFLGVDKRTVNPIFTANSSLVGSPSSSISPTAANSLIVDFVGSLGTSISENASQTVYFDQPQAASEAAGSIKLSTVGNQTMSWTTLSTAWVQLAVALEPAQALSMWFPAIDMRNLSDVISVNNLDDSVNPVGSFYATYGTHPTQYWENSFLHTVGRVIPSQVTAQQVQEYMLLGLG